MQGSKIVAGVLALGIVGGLGLALADASSPAMPREVICESKNLSFPDQESCHTQMKAAKSEVEKQQVATRYQSKIDQRVAELTQQRATPKLNTTAPQPESLPKEIK